MPLKKIKKASTSSERQARRRKREKRWLQANGWKSWEALHTALMKGTARLITDAMDVRYFINDKQVLGKKKQE